MPKIKLVAFDWNGTLLDDIDAGVIAESATRVAFGYPETTVEEIREYFQIPIRQYWLNAGLDIEIFDKNSAEIDRIFQLNYEPLEQSAGLVKGTRELLERLSSKQIDLIIFSNHIVPHISKQIKRLGVDNYFKEILARPDRYDITHHQKTFKDELLANYVRSHKIEPAQVITVGDTIEEIEIAKRFGYISVALIGGWQNEHRLKAARPDYIIQHPIDLLQIIE